MEKGAALPTYTSTYISIKVFKTMVQPTHSGDNAFERYNGILDHFIQTTEV